MRMRNQPKGMPFTPEQMKQVFDTNLINFAVQNGFQIEKGDRNTVHVKNSGGLYFFNNGKGFYCFSTEKKGNIVDFAKDYFGLDFIGAVEMILNCKAYEQKGFTVKPPTSPDYVADIFHKEKPIAFFSKADTIIKNPFVEVPAKLMDKLQNFAKSTAMACGICTDKPYDEEQAQKLENHVVKINEHNGVVLACKQHELFGYVLSTYRKDEASKMPIQRQYFYNKESAFESFAVRSGLIDEKKLFTETELKVLHAGLVKMRTIDKDMDSQDLESVGRLVDKIEDILPELQKRENPIDFFKILKLDFGMERE